MTKSKRGAAGGADNVPVQDDVGPPQLERLHKFLASTGAGSRRECETFIQQRRVSVNGKLVTKMGMKVDPFRDKVMFDGETVKVEEKVYWILNKPSHTICTNSDERGRARVVDLIPDQSRRIYTVGRLDAESRGLILLTNDGAIANVICHPRYRIEKVYQVAVQGSVTKEQIARVEAGVWLAEGKTSPASVKALGRNPKRDETVLEMTVFEGRNREVRRVLARVGLSVKKLLRTRVGPLSLGRLPPGGFRKLDPSELDFVADAERLYEANREIWDAEIPQKKGPRRGGGGGAGRGPKHGFSGPGPKGGARPAGKGKPAGGPATRAAGGRGRQPTGGRSGGGGSGDRTAGREGKEPRTRTTRRYYD
jgi:23S rRNA pseudouridine2605 synthase